MGLHYNIRNNDQIGLGEALNHMLLMDIYDIRRLV